MVLREDGIEVDRNGLAFYLRPVSMVGTQFVKIPRYIKGDIWLSADKSKAFMVRDSTHMHRLFSRESLTDLCPNGGVTGHDTIQNYRREYGPLIKWEPQA